MGKESFIFYASFDEALRELPDKSRLKIYDAICEYALRGKEVELKGVEKAVFSLVKPQILANNKRYENGLKGGRGKKREETEEKPSENQNKTKRKPKRNQTESTSKPNENVNVNENVITPPLYSPPKVGEKNKKEVFCEKFPRYKKGVVESNVDGIDFELLLSELEKSSYLRSLYTFKQVLELYPAIVKGEFRDKQSSDVEEKNSKIARERFYSDRRERAMAVAEKYCQLVRKNKRYKEVVTELSKMEVELAKAELYEPNKLNDLNDQKVALEEELEALLAKMGVEKEWLEARPYCKKCSDTGYLPNGRSCDCYKEA